MKSIAIIGTGGVGGYFGAKMAAAGYEVTFFARGTHLEALRRDGISVRSFLGDFSVPVVAATGVIDEMPAADLVLVCLKAWQVKGIIPELKRIMKPNTVVLPLQNGVTIAQELRAGLGAACVVPGLCRIISMIDSPGVISHIGVQPTIVFGEETGQTTDRVLAMKAVFDNSGFNSRLVGDIQADLWKKFISICVGGVLAVHSKTYGEVCTTPELRQEMMAVLTEIYELALAIGVKLEADFVVSAASVIDTHPFEATSSLARDFLGARPSEIDYQTGSVVAIGQKHGFTTPVNERIYNILGPIDKANRRAAGVL